MTTCSASGRRWRDRRRAEGRDHKTWPEMEGG